MPKPSIRTLILLRKERDRIEADLRENDRKVAVETPAASKKKTKTAAK